MASNAFSTQDSEIRALAQEVLDYWYDDVGPSRWWQPDKSLDAEIKDKWGKLRKTVIAADAKVWREGPKRALAAIIMLDQFSRHIHRGKAEAFAHDRLARELTRRAIAKGWDKRVPEEQRFFFYMPLMHSEELSDQKESVAMFATLSDEKLHRYAKLHYQQIDEHGRFPGRNKALGRTSTPEERIALEGGAGF